MSLYISSEHTLYCKATSQKVSDSSKIYFHRRYFISNHKGIPWAMTKWSLKCPLTIFAIGAYLQIFSFDQGIIFSSIPLCKRNFCIRPWLLLKDQRSQATPKFPSKRRNHAKIFLTTRLQTSNLCTETI